MKNCIDIEKQYNDWVDKACDFVDLVGPTINMPAAAMQSKISMALGNDIKIMFLGHDAHEADSTYIFENSNYFRYRCNNGNDCWDNRDRKWPIWKNLRDCFINVYGNSSIMDDLNHLVFTNAIFFTGDKIKEVLDQIGTSVENRCMELTRDLIFDILQPKLLVCFSVEDVFDKLIGSVRKKEGFREKIIVQKFKPYHIKNTCAITQVYSTRILGIPHPSGAHGVLASLPAVVRIINDLYNGVEIEKIVATKDKFLDSNKRDNNEIGRIIAIKDKIKRDGTNQWIDPDGRLVHEYFCKGKIKKYIKGNGAISIGLKIENESKWVLSILSNGNHPEKFEKMICDYCNSKGWLKSDDELSYTKELPIDESVIVGFMTNLLQKMKMYRETDIKE